MGLDILKDKEGKISIEELSKITSIRPQDIRETLQDKLHIIKYHRGDYVIDLSKSSIDQHLHKKQIDPNSVFVSNCEPSKLHWTPFVLANKRQKIHY
eukprot:TRINITY_DN41251_c0_g1_i1.p1 TRINITY_DN41251_c0_g1~~TRINITY_DN41251_c0_g1_i1.p1  ORF type:complete len:105 (-),score=24.30 TRINITY_DN41251_c0_g1_i1:17-307(-)